MLRFSALLLAVRAAHVEEDFSHAPDPITGEHGRLLLSAGCSQCCNGGNCLQGFNGMPGICCSRATPGCCPMGASCVRCNMRFICSNSAYVSKSHRCSMCAAHNDVPAECRSGSMSHGAGGLFLLLLLVLCVGCFCMQQQQQYEARSFYGEPAVGYPPPGYQGYPGQPVYGQPAVPMYSQPMYGGGFGGPGVGMASGAAAGFVGGMVVGEIMSGGHHHGGGWGGDGGMGGGGDMGFEADM
mmetsp:Transcript_25013/g.79964  ORF Transcript_25013/g.79964 Transcript_25013/m.79964 type:complete len:240 (+) Transcript_25013:54-773(+)